MVNTKEDNYSPSLKVIKDACVDLHYSNNSIIFDPTLEYWGRQGILLLNSALTTEVNKIGFHTMMWRPFISSFLKNFSEINPGTIYVLFGEQAKTFKPYIPADKVTPEITVTSIIMGVLLSVIFGAANAYLGLRVGMTVSASIPAAVISMGVIRIIMRKNSILESNLVQTIGSAGESLAAGSIFTIPPSQSYVFTRIFLTSL